MPVAPGPSRRLVLLIVAFSALVAIVFVSSFRSQAIGTRHPNNQNPTIPAHHVDVQQATLTGGTIMPKLGNETLKAELGRASWKLFHTIMARYPDAPDADERTALQSYIHLFVRLYPCGECAEHFRLIVDKFPPQVSSRSAAAAWACHVHNEVNKSLGKDVFDCANIGDFYDCGCVEDGKEAVGDAAVSTGAGAEAVRSVAGFEKPEMSLEQKERMTGANGRKFDMDLMTGDTPLRLEKEG
ncbi:hypothetical protein LTR36_002175 [Oleoguttula mirabilis]|uniref:Sulfhydryl oxidase n=1 Tax=Oleoguttula mirabilis TaxID=1507867 RepID=A0AAV9JNC0_9PEZI|nr:hypothetical protein LTR36_002175 [Oleoguttula mirabilis]